MGGTFGAAARGAVGLGAGLAREAASTAACLTRYAGGIAPGRTTIGRPTGDPARDTPVLLVHGWGHNRSGFEHIRRALRTAGFSSIHTHDYLVVGSDVAGLANGLARRVREVQQATGSRRVHLVGHSLGGILVQWYVQELGGSEHVPTATAIGSPFGGAPGAIAGPGRVARELRPGSAVLRRLEHGARPSDVRWTAFQGEYDFVVPAHLAELRPAALHAENILVRGCGHVALLASPFVARALTRRIAEGSQPLASITELHPPRPFTPESLTTGLALPRA